MRICHISAVLVGLVLGFVLLIQGLAHLSWALAGAGEHDLEALRSRTSENVARQKQVPHHEVREWGSNRQRAFSQSGTLDRRVERGDLPPVDDRLPIDPLVVDPPQQMGPYGGTWQRYAVSSSDVGVFSSRLTYDGLVRWSPMGDEVRPNLAKTWKVHDGGRSYTIHLRQGVRWSDGEPFDADDILFWHEHVLLNEALTPVVHPEWRPGGEVVQIFKVDKYTVRFEFAVPHALFVERTLASAIVDAILVPSHYMKQFHVNFAGRADLRAEIQRHGYENWYQLYSYMDRWQNPDRPTLRAWKLERPPPARPVIFTRNPYYWKVDPEGRQLPYIERMSFDIFDVEIITMRAIEGRLSMQKRHIRFDSYPLLMGNHKEGGYRVHQWRTGSGNDLVVAPNLNHRDPQIRELFEDRRFRIALSLAIDRAVMNQVRYFGQAEARQVAASSESPYYDAAYEQAYIEHDPQQAEAMLKAIGLERRHDGRWLGRDGRPLRFQIDVTNIPGGGDAMVDLVADAWTAIGIQTDVNRLARPLFVQRREALMHDFIVWEGEWEDNPIVQPRWYLPSHPGSGSMHAIGYARWFASRGRRGEEPTGDLREAMEIYWDIEREMDRQKRIEKFQRISELNRKNLWVIGTLGKAPVPVVVHNDMRNVPDVALSSWEVRSPGNTATECYALDRRPSRWASGR